MVEALKPYLTGNARYLGYGAPSWYEGLAKFIAANPYGAKISSLDRDITRQTQLWEAALRKYGSEKAARRWVAPPGSSYHNKGSAADISYSSPEARKWARENAAAHGLAFPLGNEPWHVEPMGQRGAKVMPAAANTGGTSVVPPMPGGYGGAPQPAQGAPLPPIPNVVAPEANPWATALDGLGGLARSMANTGRAMAQQPPERSGPVAVGGPQLAPLTGRLDLAVPVATPKSKALAEALAALAAPSL